jgi:hypothetical protein
MKLISKNCQLSDLCSKLIIEKKMVIRDLQFAYWFETLEFSSFAANNQYKFTIAFCLLSFNAKEGAGERT